MKSLLMFWREVLTELGTWCRVSTEKDMETCFLRFEKEGDEFLTITLPNYAKDFERSLAQGQVTPDLFVGFKKRQKLPVFLGGFMELLFDRATGTIIDVEEDFPSAVDAVFAIRQLTLMFGKITKDCTPARVDAAFDAYIDCEKSLKGFEAKFPLEEAAALRKISNLLFREVLLSVDREIYEGEVRPKHGPGSTADLLVGNNKYDQYEWTTRMEKLFPFGEYAIPNWRYSYLLDWVEWLEPGAERPVRVVSVPKTQKTPRIIAIEPTCMQYMQQAVSGSLTRKLESSSLLLGMIGFTDQEPNQILAQSGSYDGSLATLDLSEASDRVSWRLVREVFADFGNFLEALDVTRSTKAVVPGHGLISLTKFASMGSALTFPIEAMMFLAIVFHGIGKALNRPVSPALIKEYRWRVRVYGDDIIVPNEYATSVMDSLELFGFKVNQNKSFWTGMFRESCGAEFFGGEDVSIVRCRREFPSSRHDVQEVLSLVSMRNQFYWKGMWRSTKLLDQKVVDVLTHFPSVLPTSPAVGRHSAMGFETHKQDEAQQRPLVKAYVVHSRIPKSEIWDEGALLKCLLSDSREVVDRTFMDDQPLPAFPDKEHLKRQGRPDVVRLKLRHVSPI